ncbi:tRNA (adenosine(37)-N6)-threonylcarbamoyltransferase complex ATPase subunit type 1 TsaE [Jannaschia formosa]|uniref:tRNA (adenosine(37)-N6)-threonylcarbamoyltransferase complex ATPase subunit type 1 TsaE n=1 Tax=Jannaschia formosa TaxID=2259592 RepID=UPI000E1B9D4A|nr:tRNA (adenosine(37)-N6)-threonylcarbamoyltransferase complex ATPase subunit type 1 TsaE [Jannaschia formosa]TFL20145.1 tRNA (adenosine(37)-N6)-threonylcarbamoyltransferase complex ATPase subunit type 1 TsaE [Jannaschia formosa]
MPTLRLPGPAATDRLARALAPALGPGDVLLLDGPVGAGKTALARAAIRAIRGAHGLPPEDVPSPTFTLVQTYEAGAFEIWHADLYRLSDPAEVLELGLAEAFDDALCLIEWPDRLGADRPAHAVTLRLAHDGPDARCLTLEGSGPTADRLRAALAGVPA